MYSTVTQTHSPRQSPNAPILGRYPKYPKMKNHERNYRGSRHSAMADHHALGQKCS